MRLLRRFTPRNDVFVIRSEVIRTEKQSIELNSYKQVCLIDSSMRFRNKYGMTGIIILDIQLIIDDLQEFCEEIP